MQTVAGLGEIAGMLRLVKQSQNTPQLRHQVALHLTRAILLGQGAKALMPDPHEAIVSCNVTRCNIRFSRHRSKAAVEAATVYGSIRDLVELDVPPSLRRHLPAGVRARRPSAEVAAAGPAQDDLIEEIVVTANKRSQSVQDVAGSLCALGAEDLDAKGIKDMYDIQLAVPSLHFGPQLGNQKITIRGISEFNRLPGVAVSLDGIYQSRSSTAHLYQLDLERIEVLRGPQGTLYGRNSNGGAVNFISAAPTREAEGLLRVGYAQYDETKIQAVYSGPIGDRLAFRISADRIDQCEGWVENPLKTKFW